MGKSAGGGGGSVAMPDPFQTAQQQRLFNNTAAMDSARMNQVSQWTPFGGSYWTGEIGSPNRTQHTVLNPILGRILFGGSYHPHFGGGMPGGGGGMPGHGDPGGGLPGIDDYVPPTQPQQPTLPEVMSGEPNIDRGRDPGGPPGRGVQYDSFGDFLSAMRTGINTGHWGAPYSGTPGHGRVGAYSGPDADLARDVAITTLGSFHPVNRGTAVAGGGGRVGSAPGVEAAAAAVANRSNMSRNHPGNRSGRDRDSGRSGGVAGSSGRDAGYQGRGRSGIR